jgi:hypothetical protein
LKSKFALYEKEKKHKDLPRIDRGHKRDIRFSLLLMVEAIAKRKKEHLHMAMDVKVMPDNGLHVVKHKMIRKALNKITVK